MDKTLRSSLANGVLARYFIVGACAAAVDIGVFLLLATLAGVGYLWAATISFVLGTLVNYWLSIAYAFRNANKYSRHVEIVFIYLVSGIGLGLHQAILFGLVAKAGMALLPAKLGATGVVFIWNYWSRKQFIFAKPGAARA
ncbi:MAG: GtrA family protein [Betaproteobacteria bacterium]|nr:GtrA family protein [Betaproteobacteria bacterium]